MEEHLVAVVQQSLALYLHDNACFLCERLVAQFPSEVRPHRQLPPAAAAAARLLAALLFAALLLCPAC